MQHLPEYIEIPGEQSQTKVYEYLARPMMCKNCLEYGHTQKHCRYSSPTCGKCGETRHSVTQCSSQRVECHHCGEEHVTGSATCTEYKYQKEILAIQSRHKISRQQARIKLNENKPNFRQSFATIASKTNNSLINVNDKKLNKFEITTPKAQPTLESMNGRSKRQKSNSGNDDDGGEVRKKMAEAVCEDQAT